MEILQQLELADTSGQSCTKNRVTYHFALHEEQIECIETSDNIATCLEALPGCNGNIDIETCLGTSQGCNVLLT